MTVCCTDSGDSSTRRRLEACRTQARGCHSDDEEGEKQRTHLEQSLYWSHQYSDHHQRGKSVTNGPMRAKAVLR